MPRHRTAVALAFTVASLLAASPAFSGTKPWTQDDLIALKSVSDPQISPDGTRVVYVVTELSADGTEFTSDLWLVSAAGGPASARRLTSSLANDDTPRWSPDGAWIAFLSERPRPKAKKDDKDDEAKRQVWLIRPDGGEATVLSDAPGSVSALAWSADGKTIAFLAREPKSEERKKREKEKDDAYTPSSVYPWSRLWVLDVATRKATQLTKGELHVTGVSLSPDGSRVAFAAQPTPEVPDGYRSDLYVVPTAGGEAVALVARKGSDTRPAWSPDGKWIAFVCQDGKNDEWFTNSYACAVPAAGGAVTNLTASHDERIGGIGGADVTWAPDSRSVLFAAPRKTDAHLMRASLDGKVEPLTKGAGLNGDPSVDAKGTAVAFLHDEPEKPREVHVLPLAGGEPRAVTDTNPLARDFLSFPKQVVSWKGAGGLAVEGLLILPTGYEKGRKVPLILNVHGGPAGTHSAGFTPASRIYPWALLAQKGWAVLLPNPRGSGGYGEKFRAANVRDWAGADYVDLMAGVDAMVAQGIADPDRLAVCGWSYGGFMTSNIVTKTTRFKAAVVGAGVTDLISFTGTSDIPEFARSYFGAWPWEDLAVHARSSAVLSAGKVRTPTLVIHGDKDDRVPPSQGWELWNALRKTGVPTDLLLLPRQPHGPREPKLILATQKAHVDWFEKYVPGAPK